MGREGKVRVDEMGILDLQVFMYGADGMEGGFSFDYIEMTHSLGETLLMAAKVQNRSNKLKQYFCCCQRSYCGVQMCHCGALGL